MVIVMIIIEVSPEERGGTDQKDLSHSVAAGVWLVESQAFLDDTVRGWGDDIQERSDKQQTNVNRQWHRDTEKLKGLDA